MKRYDPINSDGTCGMCVEDADYGAYVEYSDYAALEAELAKLRAELERRAVPDGMMLLTDDQVKRHAITARECPPQSRVVLVSSLKRLASKNAAPSAPATVQGVNQQLREALEYCLADFDEWHEEGGKPTPAALDWSEKARAAIAAAQEGGKV